MNQAMTSPMTSTSCAVTASGSPVSLSGFNRWLLRARAGDWLEYHRGHLVRDRWPTSTVDEKERHQLGRLADAALHAAEGGLIHLVQRRNGPFDFSYLAIKRGQPVGAGAAVRSAQPLPVAA